MRAFLHLNLAAPDQFASYQQPEVQLVKNHFPEVAVLDLDAASDEMLLHYARRLLLETEQIVVCIRADEQASFQLFATLLETMLQAQYQLLVLFFGENQRVQRILEARPQLNVEQVNSDADLLEKLKVFYS